MIRVLFFFFTLLNNVALAQEATAPSTSTSLLMQLPIFIAFFVLFYFALIRPQKLQQKKHQEFLSQLKVGDQVVTSSGILGVIQGLTDQVVTLEVSPDTEIKVLRSQIQGSLKDSMGEKAQSK